MTGYPQVVNWSYILKYLLATSSKLRAELQQEKRLQASAGERAAVNKGGLETTFKKLMDVGGEAGSGGRGAEEYPDELHSMLRRVTAAASESVPGRLGTASEDLGELEAEDDFVDDDNLTTTTITTTTTTANRIGPATHPKRVQVPTAPVSNPLSGFRHGIAGEQDNNADVNGESRPAPNSDVAVAIATSKRSSWNGTNGGALSAADVLKQVQSRQAKDKDEDDSGAMMRAALMRHHSATVISAATDQTPQRPPMSKAKSMINTASSKPITDALTPLQRVQQRHEETDRVATDSHTVSTDRVSAPTRDESSRLANRLSHTRDALLANAMGDGEEEDLYDQIGPPPGDSPVSSITTGFTPMPTPLTTPAYQAPLSRYGSMPMYRSTAPVINAIPGNSKVPPLKRSVTMEPATVRRKLSMNAQAPPAPAPAPSQFAHAVVKELGIRETSQAKVAMSVVDRVAKFTPEQLQMLDPETREQILQVRRELGIDSVDKSAPELRRHASMPTLTKRGRSMTPDSSTRQRRSSSNDSFNSAPGLTRQSSLPNTAEANRRRSRSHEPVVRSQSSVGRSDGAKSPALSHSSASKGQASRTAAQRRPTTTSSYFDSDDDDLYSQLDTIH